MGRSAHVAYTIVVFVILASLDNAALVMLPSMVLPVSESLGTSELAIGVLSGVTILVTALTAVVWGYAGDARSRKPLLFWGTIIWSGGTLLSATADSIWQLAVWQMVVAVGAAAVTVLAGAGTLAAGRRKP